MGLLENQCLRPFYSYFLFSPLPPLLAAIRSEVNNSNSERRKRKNGSICHSTNDSDGKKLKKKKFEDEGRTKGRKKKRRKDKLYVGGRVEGEGENFILFY